MERRQWEPQQQEEVLRVKLPRGNEVFGVVEIRLGFGKSRVICTDGKVRICKVPGHLKRELWVRPNNIVLVKPWEIEGEKKGDVIYKYRDNQVDWLKKRGYLKGLVEREEF